ncbi:hypothetical protein TeGR_g5550 [Tetraparma gracilis]|uniref:RNA helicase n=1 Tax=Tetraparma gracilis TaxID=2962635 RepID=A0ABQ6MIQ5_9STRA|nr:hypothetical protein TeGR_g5550 [Tetraparma gracilis]
MATLNDHLLEQMLAMSVSPAPGAPTTPARSYGSSPFSSPPPPSPPAVSSSPYNSAPPPPPSPSPSSTPQLPIDAHQAHILHTISSSRVSIIEGETGCGKSSRVPLMLLRSVPGCRMFISQPRRIAASSLKDRVCSTDPDLARFFGLRLGHGHRSETPSTRVWFCTTGYLVRLLAHHPDAFRSHTHLVIDEVHERSVDTDILCLLTRRLLHTNPRIKLVLMSATLSSALYQSYFQVEMPPVQVKVRLHPIEIAFADEFDRGGGLVSLMDQHGGRQGGAGTPATDNRVRKEQYKLALRLIRTCANPRSAVLVFVPGMADIVELMDTFEKEQGSDSRNFTLLPIHGDIPFDDQLRAFQPPEPGEIKVVIATNAAESGITLPDVDTVVDFGLSKQIDYNPSTHRCILTPVWISKASAKQRAGRTGRVRPGKVYRLYTEAHFHGMDETDRGEILRTPLDSVILNLKEMLPSSAIEPILEETIEPPSTLNIESSFASLHKNHLLSSVEDDEACELTEMGRFVTQMGMDISVGRFLGMCCAFGVVNEALYVAAVLSAPKLPWRIANPLIQEGAVFNAISRDTYLAKERFDLGTRSDVLQVVNLMLAYERQDDEGTGKGSGTKDAKAEPKVEPTVEPTVELKAEPEVLLSTNQIRFSDISEQVTEEELEEEFAEMGAVRCVYIAMDKKTKRSLGFGFVTFERDEDAQRAMEELQGHELGQFDKATLNLEWAKKEKKVEKAPSGAKEALGLDLQRRGLTDTQAKRIVESLPVTTSELGKVTGFSPETKGGVKMAKKFGAAILKICQEHKVKWGAGGAEEKKEGGDAGGAGGGGEGQREQTAFSFCRDNSVAFGRFKPLMGTVKSLRERLAGVLDLKGRGDALRVKDKQLQPNKAAILKVCMTWSFADQLMVCNVKQHAAEKALACSGTADDPNEYALPLVSQAGTVSTRSLESLLGFDLKWRLEQSQKTHFLAASWDVNREILLDGLRNLRRLLQDAGVGVMLCMYEIDDAAADAGAAEGFDPYAYGEDEDEDYDGEYRNPYEQQEYIEGCQVAYGETVELPRSLKELVSGSPPEFADGYLVHELASDKRSRKNAKSGVAAIKGAVTALVTCTRGPPSVSVVLRTGGGGGGVQVSAHALNECFPEGVGMVFSEQVLDESNVLVITRGEGDDDDGDDDKDVEAGMCEVPRCARFLTALCQGRRKDYCVITGGEGAQEKWSIGIKPPGWHFLDQRENSFLPDNSTVAATYVLSAAAKVFAIAGNRLDLSNGMSKADLLTVLPAGDFLGKALLTGGLDDMFEFSLHVDKSGGQAWQKESQAFCAATESALDSLTCEEENVRWLCRIFGVEVWPDLAENVCVRGEGAGGVEDDFEEEVVFVGKGG